MNLDIVNYGIKSFEDGLPAIAIAKEVDKDAAKTFCMVKVNGVAKEMFYQPQDGDKLLIIEDVITAGTAVRETLPVLQAAARVQVPGLIISVDRMERGQGELTAIEEIKRDFGIRTFALVTVQDILASLYGKEIDGRVLIDDAMRKRMEAYMATYCVAH